MRKIHSIIFLICLCCILIFQSCEFFEVSPPNINVNKGFLAYSSGTGIITGNSMASYSDGYILLGSTDSGNDRNYFLVKTDKNGNIIKSIVHIDNSTLDNIPREVLIKDDLIYALGDRFDIYLNRIVPNIFVFKLQDLSFEKAIYLDSISRPTISTLNHELSVGFIKNNNTTFIATNREMADNTTSILTYTIKDLSNPHSTVTSKFEEKDPIPTSSFATKSQGRSIKKGKSSFFVAGSLYYEEEEAPNEIGTGYFILEYDWDGNYKKTWYNESFISKGSIFSDLLDFEVISDTELAILYRIDNELKLDLIRLTGTMNTDRNVEVILSQPLDTIYANDRVIFDNDDTLNIIDASKHAYIQKINNDYIISWIDATNTVTMSKIGIDFSIPRISTAWERKYNNTNLFTHSRNSIGRPISRIDGNGYAIIGTHDFLNDTKMIFMQLDQDGNYIK